MPIEMIKARDIQVGDTLHFETFTEAGKWGTTTHLVTQVESHVTLVGYRLIMTITAEGLDQPMEYAAKAPLTVTR
ncbi:hypothetical protein BH09ACT9_BH09ACT9_00530 [soil metagenome]